MKYKRSSASLAFDVLNITFLIVLSYTFLYPLLNTAALSLSSPESTSGFFRGILPKGFNLESYIYLLSDSRVLKYYLNTILYALTSTVVRLILTSTTAYPLTFEKYSFRKPVTILLTITMFFSGGLIPTYLMITRMGIKDTLWVYILPSAISAWNVIIFRTFFSQIPVSLREAAHIDGAGHMRILFTIYLPLSKALLATIGLFSVVGCWNDFMTALLYLNSKEKYPIQMFLRSILIQMEYRDMFSSTIYLSFSSKITLRTTKSAAIIMTILPILFAYPFVQKHFTKGVLIGSIKG